MPDDGTDVMAMSRLRKMWLPTGKRVLGLAAAACGMLLLASCVESKMRGRLHENAGVQRDDFEDLFAKTADTQQTPIGWREAYRRMCKDNLSLRQSETQLEQSKRIKRDQWMTLAPRIAAFASLGDSISALTNLGGSDINAEVVTSLNIPNPFQFYASLYSAALQRQNAEWSHELDKRRAYIELHSLFMEQKQLDESEAQLKNSMANDNLVESEDLTRAVAALRTEARNYDRMRSILRIRANQLLNTPGANWKLKGEPPAISYKDRLGKMEIGEDFGKLALNLQAIQIEGALLRCQQVKFQQWPAVNFGFSGPPLYSNNGQSTDFSSDNLWFFSGAYKTVDLNDPIGRTSISQAENRLQYTREQLRMRVENDSNQMREAYKTYQELLAEEQRLQTKIRNLENSSATEPVILLAELGERAQLISALGETRRRIRQIDLQLLIWDETFWK
jgi:hypothetical protein